MARALTAFVLAAVLTTVSWFRLEQRDVPRGAVLAVIGIALLPTLAVALGRRRAVVAGVLLLATIFAAGVAWEVSPLEARPGSGHDFFGPVLGAARDGLQDFYDATLPFDRVDYPTMHGLILLAVFGFSALVGCWPLRDARSGRASPSSLEWGGRRRFFRATTRSSPERWRSQECSSSSSSSARVAGRSAGSLPRSWSAACSCSPPWARLPRRPSPRGHSSAGSSGISTTGRTKRSASPTSGRRTTTGSAFRRRRPSSCGFRSTAPAARSTGARRCSRTTTAAPGTRRAI